MTIIVGNIGNTLLLHNILRVLSRWAMALLTASIVTALLIGFMHVLIATPKLEVPKGVEYKKIEFVLVEKVIKTLDVAPKPIKPKPIEEMPERVPLTMTRIDENGGVNTLSTFNAPVIGGEGIVTAPSNLPVARMMISPDYPARAANRGIEGYVDVRFDITKTGATMNVEVIGAMPANVFDKSAVKAIKRWKYTPYENEGEIVAFYGMTRRVVFNLEK